MLRFVKLAVAGVVLVAGHGANESRGLITGNQLLSFCTPVDTPTCVGYIAGVADGLMLGKDYGQWKGCLPADSTAQQLEDVTVKFLVEHPAGRHLLASGIVAEALARAFPCPSK